MPTLEPLLAAPPPYPSICQSLPRTAGALGRFYPVQPPRPRSRALPKRAVGWGADMGVYVCFSDAGTRAGAPGTRRVSCIVCRGSETV